MVDAGALPEVPSHQKIQRMLCLFECPLKKAYDPLTSHMMTSSPRAPPPPLTLTGATFGTKQAQRKLNHDLDCLRKTKRILLNHIALNEVITATLSCLLFTNSVHHTAKKLGFC